MTQMKLTVRSCLIERLRSRCWVVVFEGREIDLKDVRMLIDVLLAGRVLVWVAAEAEVERT